MGVEKREGEKISFSEKGGWINIVFGPKYRPLPWSSERGRMMTQILKTFVHLYRFGSLILCPVCHGLFSHRKVLALHLGVNKYIYCFFSYIASVESPHSWLELTTKEKKKILTVWSMPSFTFFCTGWRLSLPCSNCATNIILLFKLIAEFVCNNA